MDHESPDLVRQQEAHRHTLHNLITWYSPHNCASVAAPESEWGRGRERVLHCTRLYLKVALPSDIPRCSQMTAGEDPRI